jgi:Asp-tRNA(Asn)/Glu-tRNA(Gln) amidotransferase C subunit
MKLKEEIPDISKLINLSDEDNKIEKFSESLEDVLKFADNIQNKILNGSEEDRQEIEKYLENVKTQVEKEKNKLFEMIGVSEDELQEFINNKENFSEEEWNAMQEVKSLVKDALGEKEKINKPTLRKRKKAAWIQS